MTSIESQIEKKAGVIQLVLFFLLWEAAFRMELLAFLSLPSPWQICGALADLVVEGLPPGSLFHRHALASLVRVFAGFGMAVVLGVPFGLLMGWSPLFHRLTSPFVEMLRPIPPLAWIPLSILLLGIGLKSAAFIIFLGAFFPIVLNSASGANGIDRQLIEAARIQGAGTFDLLIKVTVPGALPAILTGIRIGLGVAWMTLVAAEFTGIKNGYGLGYLIMMARDIQRADMILAGMATIGLIGFLIDSLLGKIESNALQWR